MFVVILGPVVVVVVSVVPVGRPVVEVSIVVADDVTSVDVAPTIVVDEVDVVDVATVLVGVVMVVMSVMLVDASVDVGDGGSVHSVEGVVATDDDVSAVDVESVVGADDEITVESEAVEGTDVVPIGTVELSMGKTVSALAVAILEITPAAAKMSIRYNATLA